MHTDVRHFFNNISVISWRFVLLVEETCGDTDSHNRLDLIQRLMPTLNVCYGYLIVNIDKSLYFVDNIINVTYYVGMTTHGIQADKRMLLPNIVHNSDTLFDYMGLPLK
jgi:hypothetical protein